MTKRSSWDWTLYEYAMTGIRQHSDLKLRSEINFYDSGMTFIRLKKIFLLVELSDFVDYIWWICPTDIQLFYLLSANPQPLPLNNKPLLMSLSIYIALISVRLDLSTKDLPPGGHYSWTAQDESLNEGMVQMQAKWK